MLNKIARSRMAMLKRGESIPAVKPQKCPRCGFTTRRKRCPKCKGSVPILCRLCDSPLPKRRQSWCSDECVDTYSLLASSQYLRSQVFQRDKGVCARCQLDTKALEKRIAKLSNEARKAAYAVLRQEGFDVHGGWYGCDGRSLWTADHIEPLIEGGSWELRNVQTLCRPCDKEKTAEDSARRAKQRRLLGRKTVDTKARLKRLEEI